MDQCELKEEQPEGLVKIVDGEPAGMATEAEILGYRILRGMSIEVDPGMVEIALAVAAVSGVLATLEWPLPFRLGAGCAFVMGSLASAYLYSLYSLTRIPMTLGHYLSSRANWLPFPVWLIAYYPVCLCRVAFAKSAGESFEEQLTELGHLTLLGAIALTEFVVLSYVMWLIYVEMS